MTAPIPLPYRLTHPWAATASTKARRQPTAATSRIPARLPRPRKGAQTRPSMDRGAWRRRRLRAGTTSDSSWEATPWDSYWGWRCCQTGRMMWCWWHERDGCGGPIRAEPCTYTETSRSVCCLAESKGYSDWHSRQRSHRTDWCTCTTALPIPSARSSRGSEQQTAGWTRDRRMCCCRLSSRSQTTTEDKSRSGPTGCSTSLWGTGARAGTL